MRRYVIISVVFHAVFFVVGAVVAPLRGFSGLHRPETIVSVGLIDFADPGSIKGGVAPPAQEPPKIPAPPPSVPEPAADEMIADDPSVKNEPEELKVAEKPKAPEKPKPEPKPKPESAKKPAQERPSQRSGSSQSPQLASADTGGISGSLMEGGGGGDIWGVETGANANPYHRQGFAAIRNNWRNPSVGREAYSCIVRFKVLRSGDLTDIELDKKSGNELFGRAAMRAVQTTRAWQSFPSHWKENDQIIYLEFQYRP